MASPKRIAVLLPNWVGDVVMATPALRALRAHCRSACISYVGCGPALATLSGTEWADRMVLDTSRRKPMAAHFLAQVPRVRAGRFDLAVLLPNSFRSALLAWLAGVRRIAGYNRHGRGWMLSDKLRPPRRADGGFLPVPTIRYYLDLLEILGVPRGSARMELPVTATELQAADRLLDEAGIDRDGPLVMLNPGASFGVSKLWEPSRFAALADLLTERHGAQIIVNAAPPERPIAAQVVEAMGHRPAISFAHRRNTIGLLKGLMRRCTLLVTNDTGARHIAAAMGIGVVTLFGSTDPRWSQIDYEHERIVRVDVPCSPCQSKMCLQPAGPLYHQCMAAITPEMALAACEDVLAGVRGAGREPAP